MSIKVPLTSLKRESLILLKKDLNIVKKVNRKYNKFPPSLTLFEFCKEKAEVLAHKDDTNPNNNANKDANIEYIILPLIYYISRIGGKHPGSVPERNPRADLTKVRDNGSRLDLARDTGSRTNLEALTVKFDMTVSPRLTDSINQAEVIELAISELKKKRGYFLALSCSLGKTYCSLSITRPFGLKTFVLTHRKAMPLQWSREITDKTNCDPSEVIIITSKTPIDKKYKNASFYLVNVDTARNLPADYFKFAKFLIVDEAERICTQTLSKIFTKIFPDYTLGLSATPRRKDGWDAVLDVYFGPERCVRTLISDMMAYKVDGIELTKEENKQGDTNWSQLMKQSMYDTSRNRLITEITAFFLSKFRNSSDPDFGEDLPRKILIFTKEVRHCQILNMMLRQLNCCDQKVKSQIVASNKDEYDADCDVIVTIYSKFQAGRDDKTIGMIIFACDKEDIEQALGRGQRYPGTLIVVDIVDKYSSITRHWNQRRKLLLSRGCDKIRSLEKDYEDYSDFTPTYLISRVKIITSESNNASLALTQSIKS
jgi:hypothetical protein